MRKLWPISMLVILACSISPASAGPLDGRWRNGSWTDDNTGHEGPLRARFHETRDGIETLLTADGYRVDSARDVRDAIESARLHEPDLILVSLAGSPREVIFSAISIRQRAEIREVVAVVIFCPEGVDEGDEVAIGENVHLTHPDNFNQLRSLIARLLKENSIVAAGDLVISV